MITLYKDGKEVKIIHAVDVLEWEKQGWDKTPPKPPKKNDKVPN